MKNVSKLSLLAVSIVSLSGCSSIIEGRSQELTVNTNPPGASCTLTRNGMPIGTVAPTPSAILIEKTKYDILVTCKKNGYQVATYFNKSGAAGATVGNVILGGGIGWAIDSATGADNKYDTPMNITMVPTEGHMASAHSRHKSIKAEEDTVESEQSSESNTAATAQATGVATVADQSNFPDSKNNK